MAADPRKSDAATAESAAPSAADSAFWLAIDTCGPSGSVALGRVLIATGDLEIAGRIELEGRTYSATLVAAVGDLLSQAGIQLRDVSCLVAVNGPGSFTGVRVGLSAVKGLSEPFATPIVALSRLAVLAATACLNSAALDAHRSEVFLRLAVTGREPRDLLAGAEELAALAPPAEVAVCDENAAAILSHAWPSARLVQVGPPAAGDALQLAKMPIFSRQFVDPLALDGHYLRRSDAEIFGERAETAARK